MGEPFMEPEEVKGLGLDDYYEGKSQDLVNIMGSIYAAVMFLGIHNSVVVQSVMAIERTVFYRESVVGMFFALPYTFGQDVMEDPHIATDGYTYGGTAIKGWMYSGHNTSPVTNLKLDTCDLIPNYPRYCTIQEWVSDSVMVIEMILVPGKAEEYYSDDIDTR
ncbi:hypothetical protein CQW23_26039 [Capsicum baccatum]|uniref:U-box domain-containing protein n=1 Tax=Capsicum baccatum TaxID=33114 RepID=A0A2G2VMQ8_CAPBA|nr:hypothetical protein CQW23_26039 [Capsicum baccatum]